VKTLAAILAVLAALLVADGARAHKPSDSYVALTLRGAALDVRWDVALRDLDYAMGLDANGDGAVSWGEVRTRAPAIAAYAGERLRVSSEGLPCPFSPTPAPPRVVRHSDGAYLVLAFSGACPAPPRALDLDYALFFDLDPQHRGLVRVEHDAGTGSTTVAASARRAHLELAARDRWRTLGAFVRHGVAHIWEGTDHLAFLLALLLPSVLRREGHGRAARWEPVPTLRPALMDVLAIVTAFTLAHSITLTLSALDVLALPSRFVESAIAASVVLAAANNVVPLVREDRWLAAFVLGLLHGFGFSATLADLELPRADLALALFGFNAGVELGQAAVVAAFVPVAFAARRTFAYRRVALTAGSLAIAAVACVWLVERAFDLKLIAS